ncbi:hypothetical protein [Sporosarcina sp. E16_8]|uniref:phage tail fiber protein n=1 Tax=Sporosarcina sp. E16_8 TaxID=2789295 RepID=UPI001A9220CF|nr:hypothetical protein [Sporosarcina sp. E16_8]MBO0586453.1 hypothetical protein [Sporosarcina sp. E16_8]
MSNMSKYAESKILTSLLGGTVYVALYTSNPTENDLGTEVSGGAYERQLSSFSAPTVAASRTLCTNTGAISFPKATEVWGRVSHIGLRDAKTGGNLLYYKALNQSIEVKKGSLIQIRASDLTVAQD